MADWISVGEEDDFQPTFILLKLGQKDTNGDGLINQKDALGGYLVDLDGKNLKQVTPSGTDMVAWRYDKDSRKLFIQVTEDSDKDLKYTEEDHEKILMVDMNAPAMGEELVK